MRTHAILTLVPIAVVLLALTGCDTGVGPGGPPMVTPLNTVDYEPGGFDFPVERVASFWNIGPTGNKINGFRPPHYMVGMSSWKEFIEKNIEPEYRWGVRRFVLHNPFGNTTEGPMIFDQFIVAQERGHTYLTNDFVTAWRDFLKGHPDAELIGYLGKMRGVETFTQYLPTDDQAGRPDLYLERALESVRPLLEAGASGIAFDASSGASADSPVFHFMQLLQSMGLKVYVEGWPGKDKTHLGQFGVTSAERNYQSWGKTEKALPADAFQGEIMIIVTGNLAGDREVDTNPAKLRALIDDILERGFNTAAPVRVIMGAGAKS